MISALEGPGRRRRRSVGGVVVMDEIRAAVRIVAAGMPPVERAATDEGGEHCSQSANQKTMTRRAQPHPQGL